MVDLGLRTLKSGFLHETSHAMSDRCESHEATPVLDDSPHRNHRSEAEKNEETFDCAYLLVNHARICG